MSDLVKATRAVAMGNIIEVCAYCTYPWEGNFTISRDGMKTGPQVPLCDACGRYQIPSCEQIWARISEATEADVE